MAFQFPEDELFGDTVGDCVAFGPRNIGIGGSALAEAVDSAMLRVGLDPAEHRDRDPFSLSGGEKRRAAIAGVLAMHPALLILDEPTAGLDRDGFELIIRILDEYVLGGGTLLFSTHDFELAVRCAGRTAVLTGGRIECMGETAEVLDRSAWIRGLEEGPEA